mgnify:CR=1 FL=1
MFKRLQCKLFGHKRGKRVAATATHIAYQCPRCLAQWTRKVPNLGTPA